jgi:hypothetical protein
LPEYTFDGPGPHTYPSSKDLAGTSIGTVVPGDIRDTDGPLDHLWRETSDEDRLRAAAEEAEQAAAGAEEELRRAEAQAGAAPASAPAPAPPALPATAPSVPSAASTAQEG